MQKLMFRMDKKEELKPGYYVGAVEFSGPNVIICDVDGISYIMDLRNRQNNLIFITPENEHLYKEKFLNGVK